MPAAPQFWSLIFGTIVALLPIINPLSAIPPFLGITEGDSEAERARQIRRACLFVAGILVISLIGGTFIIKFFGISIPGLRIAGGLLVMRIGFRMSVESPSEEGAERRAAEARAKRDISFTPLAMPLLSGPGSIAMTIGFTSLAHHWLDYVAITIGLLIVAAICYFTLRVGSRVVMVLGENGLHALTKIMGFLLLCIGVQFIVNGLVGVATDPATAELIRQIWAPPSA